MNQRLACSHCDLTHTLGRVACLFGGESCGQHFNNGDLSACHGKGDTQLKSYKSAAEDCAALSSLVKVIVNVLCALYFGQVDTLNRGFYGSRAESGDDYISTKALCNFGSDLHIQVHFNIGAGDLAALEFYILFKLFLKGDVHFTL